MCKLPLTTPVFLPRYREARKLPSSPRWSPSQEIPRKGQASNRVTPWIASGLRHAQVGLRRAFQQASLGCSPPSSLSSFRPKRRGPCCLHYQARVLARLLRRRWRKGMGAASTAVVQRWRWWRGSALAGARAREVGRESRNRRE